ncbi:MAG: hypothetical protein WBA42_10430 [Mesorhizobium sp.]
MMAKAEHPGKDSKILMAALYMVAFGLLLAIYGYYLAPFWGYMGFEANPDGGKIALSAGVILLFVAATPASADARNFFLNVILSIYLLPAMVVYSYADKPTSAALVIWMALAVVYVVSAIPLPRVVLFRIETEQLMWSMAIATGCLLASYYALGGLSNFNLDISRVYEFRREAAEELPGVFGYLSSTFAKVVVPFGFAVSLLHRKYLFSLFFILSFILIFGFTSNKGVIFAPLVVIVTFFMTKIYNNYRSFLYIFILIILVGILSVPLMDYFGGDSIYAWYNTLLIRRALMLPLIIDFHYFDYFSENPYYYWSYSKLSLGMVSTIYDLAPPFQIGKIFFGSSDTSANTGFIGSGFAQAGVMGALLYSIGVGFILAILQSYGRYLGRPFIASVVIDLFINLINSSDFLTMFLTHGLFLSLILIGLTQPPAPRLMQSQRKPFATAASSKRS